MNIDISALTEKEIPLFIDLIREVYDEFVAPDYPRKGNETFYGFIAQDEVLKRFKSGNLMICAKSDGNIIGAHEVRDKKHIAMFFVKKQFQNIGVGKRMYEYSLNIIRGRYPDVDEITVNSSPYAENIYKSMGFKRISQLTEKDGIKFVPMKFKI